ncbi:MAG TPA: hypothetical protein PJ986_03910 [Gammaproteobacteria bacterium]|nr:hypothetical protein [Gammaproteobacteria bacterium]
MRVFRLLLWTLPWIAMQAASAAMSDAAMSGAGYRWDDGRFAVPLEIKDNAGVARRQWPVRSGVPLPRGLVDDVRKLRLVDEEGREIASQIGVTSRWWGRDDSVRWALLDFAIDLPANGRRQVWLSNDRPAAPVADPIRIEESEDAILVTTVGLRATVSRRTGQLLEAVEIDGTPVIAARREDGPVLRVGAVTNWERFKGSVWNNAGWEKTRTIEHHPLAEADYLSGPFRPRGVEIESRGPLHAVIAVHGRHRPMREGEDVVAAGIYDTTTRLHFYRGQSFIVVEHTLAHIDTERPRRMYLYRGAGLAHTLALSSAVEITIGSRDDPARAPAATRFALAPGQSAWFYQHERPIQEPPRYAFGTRGAAGGIELGTGAIGRYVDVSDPRAGLTVAIRNAWRDPPSAVSIAPDRLQLWLHADAADAADTPAEERPAHDLDFGERTSHEALLYFHAGAAADARAGDVVEAFEYPLFARAVPSWYSDCEVWSFEIARGGFDADAGGDEHWRPQRERWNHRLRRVNYNSGGHHASLSSSWLPFLRHGALADLERLRAESLWSITHNPGWAYREAELDDGEAGRPSEAHDAFMQRWSELTGFGPKDFLLWRGEGERGGRSYLNGYKILPDAEHYALFQIFEYWLLSGDRRALPAIHGFVDWAIGYQHLHLFEHEIAGLNEVDLFDDDPDALRRGHYSRIYAWMLYATLNGYDATGNRQHHAYTMWQLRRMLGLLRHRHGQLTRWDVRPSHYLPFLRRSTRLANLDRPFEGHELANWDSRLRALLGVFGEVDPPVSRAKTWMEAKGVFALHAAYRTYGDERILDGIWGLADYLSHHVLFYPNLGMVNQHTAMPNDRLGAGARSMDPIRHDRLTQVWPLVWHYTGWDAVRERYEAFTRERKKGFLAEVFQQTYFWETQNRRKASALPPAPVIDLRVEASGARGITLAWTSPPDDGPSGHAARYFVKYSDKPIREFAPTDDPARAAEKARLVAEYEAAVSDARARDARARDFRQYTGAVRVRTPEAPSGPRRAPDWYAVDAFWMAEHVDGEPAPAAAGTTEHFTVTALRPWRYLGAPVQPGLDILESGKTYYFALCSWDEDRNLSRLSNVVELTAP